MRDRVRLDGGDNNLFVGAATIDHIDTSKLLIKKNALNYAKKKNRLHN